MSNKVTERVAAGAALLDEQVPGWAERIDLDRLEMAYERCCVLGQLFGLYETGRDRLLPLTDDDFGTSPAAHGFDIEAWRGPEIPVDEWHALNTTWRALIEQRRAGGAS